MAALPQGQHRVRRRPRPRGGGARPARVVHRRGLHGRDRAAPGRRPRGGVLHGHGADRAADRCSREARAARSAVPGPDTPARRRSPRGYVGLVRHNADRSGAVRRPSICGSSGCRRAAIPPTSSRPRAATRCARCSTARVPVARYEVERALDGDATSTEGRDIALSAAADAIAPLAPSVLRSELIQLGRGRLNVSASLVESVIADPARRRAAAAAAAAREREGRAAASSRDRVSAASRGSRLRRGSTPPDEGFAPSSTTQAPRPAARRPQRRPAPARPPRADRARLPRLLPRAARGGQSAASPRPTSTSCSTRR